MNKQFYFPFGEPLRKVEQKDRYPKRIFVLGVYASAVHATWKDRKGKTKVKALAVASEPEIFWRGGNADEIINGIKIPEELGELVVPEKIFNGPSGIALDDKYLKPLGYSRIDTWLCDIIPFSRMNGSQLKAINNNYTKEIIQKYNLKLPSIPPFTKSELNSESRRHEIMMELEESRAETIILLGDEPIRHFLGHYAKVKYSRLSDFGQTPEKYGQIHKLEINGSIYNVIPLCHPRQSGRLGNSSKSWGDLHDNWLQSKI